MHSERNRDAPFPASPTALRVRLAQVYLEQGNAAAAEREARAAGDRNGKEEDCLPILADAMLLQQKFAVARSAVPRHFAITVAVRVRDGPIALKTEPIEET